MPPAPHRQLRNVNRFEDNNTIGARVRLNSVCCHVRRAQARNVTSMLTCGLFCGKQPFDLSCHLPVDLVR